MEVIRLRPATSADVDQIAQVGASAFDPHSPNDTWVRHIFPPHLQRPGHNPQIPWRAARKTARLRDSGAVIMVATVDDVIAGYAWWSLPGAASESTPAASAAAEVEGLTGVAVELPKGDDGMTFPPEMDKEAFAQLRAALVQGEKRVLGESGSKNVLELEVLAVNPAYGRRGIGRKLVQWGLEKADREKNDVFIVSTPQGKPLYLTCGLEHVGDIDVFGNKFGLMLRKYVEPDGDATTQ